MNETSCGNMVFFILVFEVPLFSFRQIFGSFCLLQANRASNKLASLKSSLENGLCQ